MASSSPERPARPRRSALADAAALRHGAPAVWDDIQLPPRFAAAPPGLPRPCAHAEAAALRWLEEETRP